LKGNIQVHTAVIQFAIRECDAEKEFTESEKNAMEKELTESEKNAMKRDRTRYRRQLCHFLIPADRWWGEPTASMSSLLVPANLILHQWAASVGFKNHNSKFFDAG
jgi:hypothetical protein